MKTSWVAVGIVVLLAGLAIAAYGLSTPTTTTSTTSTTTTAAVVRTTNRVVSPTGFWAMGAANLNQGEMVTGSVSVSNFSAAKGPIFVYVQNESSYIAWGACFPCAGTNALNKSLPSSGTYTISWTAPNAGSYFFVLDDSYYNAAAPASFSATGVTSASAQTTQTTPNNTLNYGGVAVAVIGAIVLGIGITAGAPAKKQPSV
ncbi:MAG: hypothetical protein OK452_10350 [Thaumarchaeota archaeon]|nr:hypothetical protein [Nitrososphaerota archaeon]